MSGGSAKKHKRRSQQNQPKTGVPRRYSDLAADLINLADDWDKNVRSGYETVQKIVTRLEEIEEEADHEPSSSPAVDLPDEESPLRAIQHLLPEGRAHCRRLQLLTTELRRSLTGLTVIHTRMDALLPKITALTELQQLSSAVKSETETNSPPAPRASAAPAEDGDVVTTPVRSPVSSPDDGDGVLNSTGLLTWTPDTFSVNFHKVVGAYGRELQTKTSVVENLCFVRGGRTERVRLANLWLEDACIHDGIQLLTEVIGMETGHRSF